MINVITKVTNYGYTKWISLFNRLVVQYVSIVIHKREAEEAAELKERIIEIKK